jgi:carbon-monoxide dehydrogenase small subunit
VQGQDGEAVLSCLALAIEWDGRSITTIEGVEVGGELHPVQAAFLEYGAVQCGFCTPGLIMSAKALLDTNPAPDEEAINEAMAGAICRCTGHVKVKTAIRKVVEEISSQGEAHAAKS